MKSYQMMVFIVAFGLLLLVSNPVSAQTETAPEPSGEVSMESLDGNRDGKLSYDEYLAPHEQFFKALDSNQDGQISSDEYSARYKERFEKADANKDGFVTNEEARDAGWAAREEAREKRMQRRSSRKKQ